MVQRLNWLVSSVIIFIIKLYQKFLSGKIKYRRCIYLQSCSNYALSEFQNSNNVFKSIIATHNRYKHCKIRNIICKKSDISKKSDTWHIINGDGEVLYPNQLSSFTVESVRKILYEKII